MAKISIPDRFHPLFERPILASLATVMPDGRPQLTPVWCDYDGTHIRFSTVAGRQKDRNLSERPFATLLLVDPGDDYHWLEVRGRVAEVTRAGAEEHIDRMAQKYEGVAKYAGRKPGQVRVLYKIEPEYITTYGS